MPSFDVDRLSSGDLMVPLDHSSETRTSAAEQAAADVAEMCRQSLADPLGVPGLNHCVVPGDQVVIAADPETPFVNEIIATVFDHLRNVPGEGVQITLLLPKDHSGQDWQSLVDSLPVHVREQAKICIHDPGDQTSISYLASSAAGERIYVSRLLTDADLVVSIGLIGYDEALGYRGTSSSLYPAFSNEDTQQHIQRTAHPELTPVQPRPLRELVDEVGWLLGTQFAVQVIPGNSLMPTAIVSGLPDPVLARGREVTDATWQVELNKPVEGVVVSVPGGLNFGWQQLGRALEQVAKLVKPGGRIVVVADIETPQGPAASMVRRCREPEELLKPLHREPTIDSQEMIQLILTLRKARVYLFSHMNPETVEEMGMIPITDAAELRRLVATMGDFRLIPNANFSWCRISRPVASAR